MLQKTKLTIEVQLDANKIPEKITWISAENDTSTAQEAKAILISFLEKETLDTMKLDLWTKEMQVQEMDRFMYHTINALADTYKNATNNVGLANDLRNFAHHFGEKTELFKQETN
ncbi:MAG: gliding motility protein GldC [Bacteroidota bacterium]|nr:gliding motility protein GldC [Bacteroidota bacterium]